MSNTKEQSVKKEIDTIIALFNPENLKLKNLDKINVSFAFSSKGRSDFDILSKMGYSKESNKNLSVYSRWDVKSAFASNISIDNEKNTVTVSLNY